MSKQWLLIEPHDVWMFRDSKPFTAGESYFARSVFPPQPGTMQGMVRTYHYEQTGQIIGTSTDLGDLRVSGPFLAVQIQGRVYRLYPRPLDLLPGDPPRALAPSSTLDVVTDLGDDWRPLVLRGSTAALGKSDDGELWLDEENFKRYLKGETLQPSLSIFRQLPAFADYPADRPLSALLPEKALYQFEERTGLAMNHQRRSYQRRREDAPEGLVYRAAFVRPEAGVGVLVGVEHPTSIFKARSGSLAVGGENRMGTYQPVDYNEPSASARRGRLKLILLTPAYFSAGWLPTQGWSPWVGTAAKLISVAIGKPLTISGWNMAAGSPKPLRNFIPAGSVFYFENAELPTQPLTESPIGEFDFGAAGYGAFAAAAWDYVDESR